ncbi:MAG: hypothetical protein HOG34_03570, partial [Bacteroidetes bacterium]|nr:hypothetical protein [Bacteroidota bacterium]MBT4399543.1 hypothetical protein [Bacteroidota bacterium]MBT4969748.1 hypothetical protein [Bacteroidota bacterium]MBT7465709.1 hypothetical protein [Bacteroidota bacterium]
MDVISEANCVKLSKKIRDDIYRPAYSFKTTIFLCGADISQKDMMRYTIAEALKSRRLYWYYFDIVYPEDIFDELLFGSRSSDLLSLEGLLADSVDAIVLIPESPGSFAELGAFANDEKLRQKLICIIDKKYKKDKSFINQGPLKLVKQANRNGIIYVDPNNIENEIDKLIVALKKVKKVSSKKSDRISLLQLDNFLLPSIYLLEPVSKETLVTIVSSATDDTINSYQTTTTALTILTKKRQIELTINGYKLTKLGIENFLSFRKTRSRIKKQDETIEIDNLRLEILNLKYRKKKLKV